MLSDRQLQILALIIKQYTMDHTPIGSKRLMQEGINASSATIRNDMSFLEEYGLLQKNHTSSGRIPSLQGFRYYVDHLLEIDILNNEQLQMIHNSLKGKFSEISELVQRFVNILSDLTNYAAIAFGLDFKSQILTDFRIMILNAHQVLAVIITDGGSVANNVITLPYGIFHEDLDVLTEIIHERLLGEKMMSVYDKLRTEFPIILQRYFTDPQRMIYLLDSLWEDVFVEDVYISGCMNLLDYNFINTPLEFKHLYSFFSNSKQVIHLVKETRKDLDGLGILIGKELENELFINMSLLTIGYDVAGHGSGALAVLGPANMHYSKILGLLYAFKEELSNRLAEYYRYLDSAQ
ncbi:MAG: heat-inducible transcriptional repressor HrcA [Streptococcaceae bacterium]|jgi:heat-inducible transcriptional repressor|nr:heat-inducible transcriptional repressor HrcA [Streptococcaceae bacterium]